MNVRELARGLIVPRPSLFDLAIAGTLGIVFLPDRFWQGMFFVFYSVFLLILTFFMKPKRNYISYPLALFVMWSFAMIFVHNEIKIVPDSFMNFWFNTAIMFEGFIYILFGFLLFRNIVIYSKNPKFIFLLLPIALIPLIKSHIFGGRMTILFALVISIFIWLSLNRKFIRARLSFIISFILSLGITVFSMWPWIQSKFACRPYIWAELSLRIADYPFIGSGFDHTLTPDNMIWIRKIGLVTYGWIYRHCDPLSIAAYLGQIVLIFLWWFILDCLLRIGKTVYLIPFLTIAITSFFQMTFFNADKAAICILLLGVCVKETHKKEVLTA